MKILDFLVSPKESLPLLNGWQRIWLVFTGLLLVIHFLIIIANIPSVSDIFPNTSSLDKTIEASDKWLTENRQICTQADRAVETAMLENNDYNSIGRAAVDKQRQEYLIKIEDANQKLYKIETSGGKYFQEWVKVNDQIQAYQGKLNKMTWVDRKFNYWTMVDSDRRDIVLKCNANKDEHQTAVKELETLKSQSRYNVNNFISTLTWSIVSFLTIAGSIYFLGWCIGWVRKGFKR